MQETGGTYGVALNEKHFEELVFDHALPPPSLSNDSAASLVSSLSSGLLEALFLIIVHVPKSPSCIFPIECWNKSAWMACSDPSIKCHVRDELHSCLQSVNSGFCRTY